MNACGAVAVMPALVSGGVAGNAVLAAMLPCARWLASSAFVFILARLRLRLRLRQFGASAFAAFAATAGVGGHFGVGVGYRRTGLPPKRAG